MSASARNYRLRFGRHQDQPGWFVESDDLAGGAHWELGLSAAELPHAVVVPLRTYFVPLDHAGRDELRDHIQRCLGEAGQVAFD